MASTPPDHFELIRGYIKSTAWAIFISHCASHTHPLAAEIREALEAIHGPLAQHLHCFPDDAINSDAFRAFLTSLSVAAHQLPSRTPSWNEWLIQNTPANFHANNHFMRTTILSPDYVYIGDPGEPVEDSDGEAEGAEESDSSPEAPVAPAPRIGPPTKRQRIDPPAISSRRQIILSPAPSISTWSRSQLKTAPSALATLPSKASAAPSAASVSSRTPSSTSKTRKAPSVYEVTDEEEVDELEDDPEPAPKASSSKGKGKAKTTTTKLLPREVAAIGLLSQPESGSLPRVRYPSLQRGATPVQVLGWGRRCGSCKSGGKSHCTFELKPEELDEVLQSLTPLVSSSHTDLHALIVSIERYLQMRRCFLSSLIEPIVTPPNMDILDALLSCNTTIPGAYLDDSSTSQELFPPISLIEAFFTHPDNDDLTGQAVGAPMLRSRRFMLPRLLPPRLHVLVVPLIPHLAPPLHLVSSMLNFKTGAS
ncbi:hypothetical protein BDZ97DRAFT_1764656 [Flammula alnicola]|nr:hypothetical protein BDZ97DRAFT_1764656 [Flammula alnicola]